METLTTMAGSALAAPPPLDPWQGQLGSLRIGPGTPYDWTELIGVDELPPLRSDDVARPWAHGSWAGDDLADGRSIDWTVLVEGTGAALDAALADLRAVMVPTRAGSLVPLWFNLPRLGRVVRWDVKVRRHRIALDQAWVRGEGAIAEAQLYAPDPVGYGAEVAVSTGFRAMTGGLEFDLFTDGTTHTGFLEFGEAGSTGRVEVTNGGTAETWPTFTVAGPSTPFEILDIVSGRRLQYADEVPAGSSVSLDSATGVVLLDQVADRSGALVRREWAPIPAASSSSFLFMPLGPASPAATLTVTYSPGWW